MQCELPWSFLQTTKTCVQRPACTSRLPLLGSFPLQVWDSAAETYGTRRWCQLLKCQGLGDNSFIEVPSSVETLVAPNSTMPGHVWLSFVRNVGGPHISKCFVQVEVFNSSGQGGGWHAAGGVSFSDRRVVDRVLQPDYPGCFASFLSCWLCNHTGRISS